jgi:hypothetical protein
MMSRIGHDVGDACERIIDLHIERLSWREPKSTRGGGKPNKLPPSNS